MPRKLLTKCGVKDCKFTHIRAQVVGHHRRFVHGIKGTSEAVRYANKKHTATIKKAEVVHVETAHQPIEVIAYTLGRIDQLILSIAIENDIAPKQLAGWCAKHIRDQTSR
jgi:hypothetical protein